MITATETAMRDNERQRSESILHQRFEYFLRKWAPEGESREFEADLFMLVRTIHEDAARPFSGMLQSSLKAALMVAPTTFIHPAEKEAEKNG